MKLFNTNYYPGLLADLKFKILGLLLLFVHPVLGQPMTTAPISRLWYLPQHATLQFAGNLGLFSVGPGYRFFNQKLQTELLYGYTPRFQAEKGIHALTLKLAYHPVRLRLNDRYELEPLKLGAGINYTFGDQFYTSLPDRYPENYYWWPSSLRLTPFAGSTIARRVGNENSLIQKLELYAEVGTHDLAFLSWATNKHQPFGRILNIALGTKLVFK